jgi:hypothetical protein
VAHILVDERISGAIIYVQLFAFARSHSHMRFTFALVFDVATGQYEPDAPLPGCSDYAVR